MIRILVLCLTMQRLKSCDTVCPLSTIKLIKVDTIVAAPCVLVSVCDQHYRMNPCDCSMSLRTRSVLDGVICVKVDIKNRKLYIWRPLEDTDYPKDIRLSEKTIVLHQL